MSPRLRGALSRSVLIIGSVGALLLGRRAGGAFGVTDDPVSDLWGRQLRLGLLAGTVVGLAVGTFEGLRSKDRPGTPIRTTITGAGSVVLAAGAFALGYSVAGSAEKSWGTLGESLRLGLVLTSLPAMSVFLLVAWFMAGPIVHDQDDEPE